MPISKLTPYALPSSLTRSAVILSGTRRAFAFPSAPILGEWAARAVEGALPDRANSRPHPPKHVSPPASKEPLGNPIPVTQPTSAPSTPNSLSRSTVWFMAAATGVIVANIYYLQPLLADIARTFALTPTEAGAIAMTTQMGVCLGMLLFVPLGDSHERRSLISWMLCAAAVALVLTALARNGLWLAFACFGVGMMGSCVHLLVPFAAHLAAPHERGKVVGSVFSGILLGVLLARTFSGFVGSHLGWRAVYWIAAGMILCVFVAVRFFLPRSEPIAPMPYIELLKSAWTLVREHAALRESALFGASAFCCFSAFWTTLVFLLEKPPYHYGAQAAGLFGLVGAAGAAGAPVVGRLSDKHGSRYTIGISLLILLASFLVLGFAGKNLVGLVLGVLLMDFGTQACHVANQTRIYGLVAEARSRLNMFYMVCYFAGGAAGSLLGAYAWKLYAWPGVCAFCLIVIALMLVKFTFFSESASAEPIAPRDPEEPISEF
jgi:predicted MFS family arabinose efflux permease